MPNHVTNIVEISGKKKSLEALMGKVSGPSGSRRFFDFNGIIPMPSELNNIMEGVEVAEDRCV